MKRRFRPPMFVIAAALFALIALLAALQYKWLGRVSDAERESRRSTLGTRAAAFASDFDKELTLAYMLFQVEPMVDAAARDNLAARIGSRYDRWQLASRYPRLIKDVFVASRPDAGTPRLQRFDPSTRFIEPAAWPATLSRLRDQLSAAPLAAPDTSAHPRARSTFIVRSMTGPLWEEVPALVVPMPLVLVNAAQEHPPLRRAPFLSYTILVLDREHITRDVLPALAQQHLRGLGDGVEYELAVVSGAGNGVIYRSVAGFEPKPEAKVDVAVDLFQVRVQEFAQMAADVRRFSATTGASDIARGVASVTRLHTVPGAKSSTQRAEQLVVEGGKPMPVVVDQPEVVRDRAVVTSVAGAVGRGTPGAARWRLLVKHPSGSLEAAVNSVRRRNLIISSSILAVLGASMALLVLSARRSQEVARQQMEFVAAVSHELRTPLAVIRSAGDNLAAGVVADATQIRRYGDLVRSEGRRLSEMVEQILELAGIESGQRRFEPAPVGVRPLLDDVLNASRALFEGARIEVEMDVPDGLPPVLGDEAALKRVFQNLVGNAIKYGADGRWIRLQARASGREVCVRVADRGIGIAPCEQTRIFDPFYRAADVVAAQFQGAGLGLSLVQRIVDAHGGRVAVKSALGSGSEFSVCLPAAGSEAAAGAERREAEAARYT